MNITALLQLLNLAIPAVTNLVLLVKNESGQTTAIISSTQTANADDINQIQTWIAAHQSPKPATPPVG